MSNVALYSMKCIRMMIQNNEECLKNTNHILRRLNRRFFYNLSRKNRFSDKKTARDTHPGATKHIQVFRQTHLVVLCGRMLRKKRAPLNAAHLCECETPKVRGCDAVVAAAKNRAHRLASNASQ